MQHYFSIFLLLLCQTISATEVELWHAFDAYLEEVFTDIVETFNQRSSEQQLRLKAFRRYDTLVEEGLAAQRKGCGPQILQVYEMATVDMIEAKDTYLPIDRLMAEQEFSWDPDIYVDAIRATYADNDGQLLSLPWNASMGVLFYNSDAFLEAGLDPTSPPSTWQELHDVCQQLKEAGYQGFTTAWPAAYHLELYCAIHDLPLVHNGQLLLQHPALEEHWQRLHDWQSQGFFVYGGRFNDVEELFTSGNCALLMQGANRYGLLARKATFSIAAAPLPYDDKLSISPGAPYIGGASFWALQGASEEQRATIAAFFHFLMETKTATQWYTRTGYLPCTKEAAKLCASSNNWNPAGPVAISQCARHTQSTHGIRLAGYPRLRDHIVDCFESFLRGELSARNALQQASETEQ